MQISSSAVHDYFATLGRAIDTVEITDAAGTAVDRGDGLHGAAGAVRRASAAGRMIYVVGNGGSAGIASQVTYSSSHGSGLAALCLNDPSALTGIAADHGYPQVFARQLAVYGRP